MFIFRRHEFRARPTARLRRPHIGQVLPPIWPGRQGSVHSKKGGVVSKWHGLAGGEAAFGTAKHPLPPDGVRACDPRPDVLGVRDLSRSDGCGRELPLSDRRLRQGIALLAEGFGRLPT